MIFAEICSQSATDFSMRHFKWRKNARRIFAAGFALLALTALNICAAESAPDPSRLTLDRIFEKHEFKTESGGPARWLKDGSGYTTLETSKKVKGGKDIVRYDPESGARKVLVPASHLIPAGKSKPLNIDGYAWSDDGKKLLLFTNSKRVWRQNTRGDYWLFDCGTQSLQQLGDPAEPATMMFATFSPDGRRVAYVCRNNLYVQNLKNLKITALTTNGSERLINGTSDWVYEEELYLRKAFRWSPDSRRLAYWRFDTSMVRDFKLINYTDSLYPKITSFPYPKVGQTNSACRVGVVKASGGPTRWFNTSADPRNNYIPEMEWAPNSRSVVFQQLNRLQSTNHLIRGQVKSGRTKVVFTDRDNAWVDVNHEWHWLEDGRRFLWLSERDGWRHLYVVTRHGKPTLLTSGKYDVINVAGVDEAQGWVYFIASPKNAAQRYLYRVPLDGSGKAKRVTPKGHAGTHSYQLSKDCRWAFHTYSSFGNPPVIELVDLPEHKSLRVIADNSKLRAKLKKLQPCPSEFFRVDIGDGVQLDAWCIQPPDFDPAKKYPVLFHVYGEPAGQTVLDRWGGDTVPLALLPGAARISGYECR